MSRHPQRASPVLRGECTDLCRPGRVTGDAGQWSDERGSTHAVGVRCRRPTRSSGFSVVGGRRPKDGGHPPRTSARCQVLGSVQLGAECSLLLLEKPSRQRDRLCETPLLVEANDRCIEIRRAVFFSRADADRGTPERKHTQLPRSHWRPPRGTPRTAAAGRKTPRRATARRGSVSWSTRPDSNRRPPRWQRGALPAELLVPKACGPQLRRAGGTRQVHERAICAPEEVAGFAARIRRGRKPVSRCGVTAYGSSRGPL